MISETYFCANYGSIWRALTPSMEEFVRRVNLSGYDRFWQPISSNSDPAKRGLINESGFQLFSAIFGSAKAARPTKLDDLIDAAVASAKSSISLENQPDLDEIDIEEAKEIATRLLRFFGRTPASVSISPNFSGCGIVSNCRGDVIAEDTIWEIKSGNRNFRSIDFRQLLIYSALDYAKNGRRLNKIGLANPRTGLTFQTSMDVFSYEISGLHASEVFERVLFSVSANLVSE